jgi:hypothetical protein
MRMKNLLLTPAIAMVILRAVLVTTIESAGRSTNLVATTPMLARQIVAGIKDYYSKF